MGPFISWQNDLKIVELLDLEPKWHTVNERRYLAIILYLYDNPAYLTIYEIMRLYKNYLGRSKTIAYNRFSKIMAKLKIKIKHSFASHENL